MTAQPFSALASSSGLSFSQLPWLQATMVQFSQLANEQRLAHALLISGIAGIGKTALSQQLAAFLLCKQPAYAQACGQCKSCLLLAAGNHPDLLLINGDSSIGVDEIRRLIEFTHGSAQQHGNRVVIVAQAEKMTEAAANALLKTLEEPPQGCYLLLLTSQPQRLKATLVSRCQRWPLTALTEAALQQWLAQHYQGPLPDFLFTYTGGAPLKALTFINSNDVNDVQQALLLLDQWLNGKTELTTVVKALEGRADNQRIMAYMLKHWLLQHSSIAAERQQRVQTVFYQWCRDEQQILGQNKSLALSNMLLELKRVMASAA